LHGISPFDERKAAGLGVLVSGPIRTELKRETGGIYRHSHIRYPVQPEPIYNERRNLGENNQKLDVSAQ
jgi:hypothetical protein